MKKPRKSLRRAYRSFMQKEIGAVEAAWNSFDWADEDHIDKAITRLHNLEILCNNSICEIKDEYEMPIHKTEVVLHTQPQEREVIYDGNALGRLSVNEELPRWRNRNFINGNGVHLS